MLDYLVNDLHYPLETAWQWFVTSELSARFEQGDCSVLVGLSGVELARAVLEQAGEVVPLQKPSYDYLPLRLFPLQCHGFPLYQAHRTYCVGLQYSFYFLRTMQRFLKNAMP